MHRHEASARLRTSVVAAALVALCTALIGTAPAGASAPSYAVAPGSNRALVTPAAAVTPPSGFGFTPTEVAAAGGTRITFTLPDGMPTVKAVTVNGKVAAIARRAAGELTVTSPRVVVSSGDLATLPVRLVYANGDYTDAGNVDALLPPVVTAMSPTAGDRNGGTVVTLYGSRLDRVRKVGFGRTFVDDTSGLTRIDATTLQATTPGGPLGGATVVVANAGGAVSRVRGFTYLADTALPSDPDYGGQWSLQDTYGANVLAAWTRTRGAANIVVGVVDSGGTDHPDAGPTVAGYDAIANTTTPTDPGSTWQGTQVAGIVNAAANDIDIVGVAPGVKVQHVRAVGSGSTVQQVADGIRWAAGVTVAGVTARNLTPSRVLNVDWDLGAGCPTELSAAIAAANARGATVVMGAGDNGGGPGVGADLGTSATAGACSAAVIVAAIDVTGARWAGSNYGALVDVAAPGAGIPTLSYDGTGAAVTTTVDGTVYAAAHVSAVLALALSRNLRLTPAQLQALVRTPAKNTPFLGGHCDPADPTIECGAGIVNAGLLVP